MANVVKVPAYLQVMREVFSRPPEEDSTDAHRQLRLQFMDETERFMKMLEQAELNWKKAQVPDGRYKVAKEKVPGPQRVSALDGKVGEDQEDAGTERCLALVGELIERASGEARAAAAKLRGGK